MKKGLILIVIFLLFLPSSAIFSETKSLKELPPQYRKWLEEEVAYIISPKEKEVFLNLETDRERQIFIEAFWKHRDPDPLTPENEFKKEHYRRLNYVNQWFGREGPGKGWRTDMGRIYILLGQPTQISRFENESEIFPTVVWFYQGMSKLGLPDSFYVTFFKRSGMGEYELYSPIKDGPQSLLIHYQGDATDYQFAYDQLYNINPLVANVSLSLLPDEFGRIVSPSLASEILIKDKIPKAVYEQIEDSYAEKLLAYKDIIEVEYTANYISSDACAQIIKDPSGIYFVHYAIEPKKLNLIQVNDQYRANLEIVGRIIDQNSKIIYQYTRNIPISFNQERLNKIRKKLFSFQDTVPLIEGKYRLDVLVKNTMSKEFTSMEQKLIIPENKTLWMSPLILANRVVTNSKYQGSVKPFLINDTQLLPSPRNDFTNRETLYLFFQISNLPKYLGEKDKLELEYKISRGEKVLIKQKRLLQDSKDPINILEEFSLKGFSPDYYQLEVALLNFSGQKILIRNANFFISNFSQLARPWVLSIPQPATTDPIYLNILGNQWLQKGELAKARTLLSEAHHLNPLSRKFSLDFGKCLFINKEYHKVKEIISPHLQGKGRPDFLLLSGQTCQALGELTQAISFYKEYLTHFGANLNVLNAIGECYYKLGNFKEAIVAWEKSLELNPNQEKIRKLVNSIKQNNEKSA